MIKKCCVIFSVLFLLVFTLLVLWPTGYPIKPHRLLPNQGYTGALEHNSYLKQIRAIDLAGERGGEDLAIDRLGRLYTGTKDGWIMRSNSERKVFEPWVNTQGRPLGLEFDAQQNLIVADAVHGVLQISPSGELSILAQVYQNERLNLVDDVAISDAGDIYFSAATDEFEPRKYGLYKASVLDIIQHKGNGRLFRYSRAEQKLELLARGLYFPNGLALAHDQQSLLLVETGAYRIQRLWLEGPQAGQLEPFIEGLPGMPDNLERGLNGRYWVGLIAQRNPLLDAAADRVWLRKALFNLNRIIVVPLLPRTHLIAFNDAGTVTHNLQDTWGRFEQIPGALETADQLYISSLTAPAIGVLAKPLVALD